MALSKAYLLAYNISQFCGWAYLMYRLLPYLSLQAKATKLIPAQNPASLYEELGDHLKLVQTAALLEVVHAILGLVRSNPMVVATQIARYVVLTLLWLFTVVLLFFIRKFLKNVRNVGRSMYIAVFQKSKDK